MSAWTDFRDGALSGGLARVLGVDDDSAPNADKMTNATPVEQVAPEPTIKDTEPFFQAALMRVTQNQILMVTAALVGLIGIIYLVRK